MWGRKFVWLAAACCLAAWWPAAGAAQRRAGSRAVEGEGVTGTLRRHARFASRFVEPRHVDVWLPPGYERGRARYPVVYVHDGQNLFDPATSYAGVDWGVDETLTRLVGEGRARAAIVVGVWNTPRRVNEYMPQKAVPGMRAEDLKGIHAAVSGPLVSDDYLRFLARELKPFVDAHYRTLRGPRHTFVMGASMGGLISAYALSEYPRVYGGAACLSTHWPAAEGAVIDYLARRLPGPRAHKLYFDYGTATLDAEYEPYQRRMDEVLRRRGYAAGRDWLTRKFEGAEHSERAWRERVEIPLTFLLGK